MKTIKNIVCSFVFFAVLPVCLHAQDAGGIVYVQYGYCMMGYKSDELPVFLKSYNDYYSSILSEPFEMKMGLAKGDYLKVGVGFGGIAQATIDLTIYKTKTNPLEARFADGSGRDIWAEHRLSVSDIGIRYGGTKKVPVFAQLDFDIGIQVDYLYSAYVYPDGTRSIGLDKDLNGVYDNFVLAGGTGFTVGYRLGPVAVEVSGNYISNFERKHPENHQYEDLNDVKPDLTPDYIPRSMEMYITDPTAIIENSISDDFRGWKFTFGLTAVLGHWKE